MKSVTLAGLRCVIEDDNLVIYLQAGDDVWGELTRTTVADAIIAAKWLRVLVEHAAIPDYQPSAAEEAMGDHPDAQ